MSKYSPQLIEVDPQRIRFNPNHLRRHTGAAYLRLTKSLEKFGILQPPLVRLLAAGLYEGVEGDGRIQFAQEKSLERIWVLSMGIIDDRTAEIMYQESNASRSYTFLEECRGIANLRRQGLSIKALAENYGKRLDTMREMAALGDLPEDLIKLILDDMSECEDQEHHWSKKVLFTLLRLRQLSPQKQSGAEEESDTTEQEGNYDYSEVRIAIDKVRQGKITQASEMIEYVAQRREALFQERFDQTLQLQLQDALQQANQALVSAHERQIRQIQKSTASHYNKQIQQLQGQLQSLQEQYQGILREISKRSDPEEIAKRARELELQVQFTQAERKKLEALQQRVLAESQKQEALVRAQEREREKELLKQKDQVRLELTKAREAQQQEMDKKLSEEEKELIQIFKRKDNERQLKAETTVRNSLAYGTQLLSQAQQWLLHLSSPEMRKGVAWLSESEVVALIAQMRAVRETMENTEAKFMYGDETVATERIVSSDETSLNNLDRELFNQSQVYQ